jgi:hypothetical protein
MFVPAVDERRDTPRKCMVGTSRKVTHIISTNLMPIRHKVSVVTSYVSIMYQGFRFHEHTI